jgi:hypothetical protein
MHSVIVAGDPRGDHKPIIRACLEHAPGTLIIAGDLDPEAPLRLVYQRILSAGWRIRYVLGNHDVDRPHFHDNLLEDAPGWNISGGFVEAGGLIIGGLGGVFKSQNWYPRELRAARPFLPMPLSTNWEWLALAQHHGAPTRLTDWTTSPLVAAWFAVTSYPETTDAAIFAITPAGGAIETIDVATGQSTGGARYDSPFAMTKGVYLIETAPVSARVTTHRSNFTVHGDPRLPLDVAAEDTLDIPHGFRGDFQGRLLDLGIDASHIFPELDGLCKTLDWKLKSGRGFSSISQEGA